MNGKLLKPGEEGEIVLGNHSTFCAKAGDKSSHRRVSCRDGTKFGMANAGESAKSEVVGMAIAREGGGLKRTCFLEGGGWDMWCVG